MFLTRSWFGKVLIFLSIFRVSLFARGLSSELFFLMSVTSNAFEIHPECILLPSLGLRPRHFTGLIPLLFGLSPLVWWQFFVLTSVRV